MEFSKEYRFCLVSLVWTLSYLTFGESSEDSDPHLELLLESSSSESIILYINWGDVPGHLRNKLSTCSLKGVPECANGATMNSIVEFIPVAEQEFPMSYKYAIQSTYQDPVYPPTERQVGENVCTETTVVRYQLTVDCVFEMGENNDVVKTSNTKFVQPGLTPADDIQKELDGSYNSPIGDNSPPVLKPQSPLPIIALIGLFLVLAILAIIVVVLYLKTRGSGLCGNQPSPSETELNTQDAIEQLRQHHRAQKQGAMATSSAA